MSAERDREGEYHKQKRNTTSYTIIFSTRTSIVSFNLGNVTSFTMWYLTIAPIKLDKKKHLVMMIN